MDIERSGHYRIGMCMRMPRSDIRYGAITQTT